MGETFDKELIKKQYPFPIATYYAKMQKLDDNTYRVNLTYEAEDEIDIIIRVLSFGSNLKVVGPERFIKQIKSRLEMQKSCGQ